MQTITDRKLYKRYTLPSFPYVFIKTINYRNNKFLRLFAMLQFHFRLFRLKNKFDRPDVILGSSSYPMTACLAIRLAKRFRCKSIVEVRDLWPESIIDYLGVSSKNPAIVFLYHVEKWMYCNADSIIFTMPGGVRYIHDKKWDIENGGKVDPRKVFNINNGIVISDFDSNAQTYKYHDTDLDNKENLYAIYTGSIRQGDDVQYLVEVAKCLKGTNIKILVWGEGNQRASLENECWKNNVENIIFKGFVEKKYIPSILQQANVLLLHIKHVPVLKYGYSLNKLFDYLAAGKPILSDIPSPYEMIQSNRVGILTSPTDPIQYAHDLIALIHNTDRCSFYSQNARALAFKYDFENLTRELEKIAFS